MSPDATTVSSVVTFLTNGISDSKFLTRKVHLFCLDSSLVGTALNSVPEKSLLSLVEACIKVVDRIQIAGISMLDPKKETPLLVEGYLAVRWLINVLEWEQGQTPKKHSIGRLIV